MTVIRRSKLWRTLSWLLVLAFAGTLTPVVVGPAQAQEAGPRTILVLPVADQSGRGDTRIARWIGNELVLGISGQEGLAGLEFNANSPLVRRAVSEGRVLPAQVETPPQTPTAAVAVGRALGVDAVLQMAVDTLVVTEYPKQAKISLSGELYSVAANYNFQTGEAAATPTAERTFRATGDSELVTRYDGSDQPLIRQAIQRATAQVAAAVAGDETAPQVAAPARKSKTSWVGIALGLGLLALLVSGLDKDEPAPAGAAPPVPVSLTIQTGGIQLVWQAPAPGGLTLLRYQIQRSVDGQPFQFIDGGMVGAAQTSFFDTDVSTTERHVYRYRIAAVYTTQAVSPFASFSQIAFPPVTS